MRITLNIDDIRKIDANPYTHEYIHRDGHQACDTPFARVRVSPNSKKHDEPKGEGEEELNISPYSNIF